MSRYRLPILDMLLGLNNKSSAVKEVEEEFQYYDEILAEYELIQNKEKQTPPQ